MACRLGAGPRALVRVQPKEPLLGAGQNLLVLDHPDHPAPLADQVLGQVVSPFPFGHGAGLDPFSGFDVIDDDLERLALI